MWATKSQTTSSPARSSGNLARRLRQHEAAVLPELYDQYGRMMFFVIFRMVENRPIAEALVEESFMRAWNESGDAPEEDGELGAWLIGISRGCGKNYQQSRNLSCADDVKCAAPNLVRPMTFSNS